MKIHNSLLMLISLCSIQSYGMKQNKDIDESITNAIHKHADILKAKRLLDSGKNFTLEEKTNLRESLMLNNQKLEAYNLNKPWSIEDTIAYNYRNILIEQLFPSIKIMFDYSPYKPKNYYQ